MSSGRGFIGGGGMPFCSDGDEPVEGALNERDRLPPLPVPLVPRPLRLSVSFLSSLARFVVRPRGENLLDTYFCHRERIRSSQLFVYFLDSIGAVLRHPVMQPLRHPDANHDLDLDRGHGLDFAQLCLYLSQTVVCRGAQTGKKAYRRQRHRRRKEALLFKCVFNM